MASMSFLDIIALCFGTLALLLYLRPWRRQRHESSSRDKKVAETALGDPDPLPDFCLKTAATRNHLYVNKTLRWPYYQTMAHQPMHINDWIEIDSDYKWYIDEKRRVIEEQGAAVLASLPENDDACAELLEVLVDYLPKRFPTLFKVFDSPGGGISNEVTGECTTGIKNLRGTEALRVCSRLVQDDFLMAREREDGHVYCTGGVVAFPGFYLLSDQIGHSIGTIHRPVPHFIDKLHKSVERTLKRLSPSEPFERSSWLIADDRNLFQHNIGKGKKIREDLHPKDLFLRIDHQTFRRLPRTKAVIFGVHPVMKRLEDLRDDPLIPALLTKLHEEGDEALFEYKLAPVYKDKMLPYLRELTRSQIERGLIRGDEDVSRFRELIDVAGGQEYPSKQTFLQHLTESELAMA